MAKKLVAVTGVRHNGVTFEPNSDLNKDDFTDEELKTLYDSGAITVVDVDPQPKPKLEEVKSESSE